jgi:hypothetical protein
MNWLVEITDKLQYGTVPAWFGGASLLLAFMLFLRDRRRDDRAQIDKVAVWMVPTWDPTLALRDPQRVVEPTEEIHYRIFAKNSNDVPIEIAHAAFTIETKWLVPTGDLASRVIDGTEKSRLFQDGYLLAPGEQREQPAQLFYVGHQAPAGAKGLTVGGGVKCWVQWFLATDNAGRRWEVRPGQGKRARRLRWYSYGRRWYPVDWRNPIVYPLLVRFFIYRDWISGRHQARQNQRDAR